MLGWPSSLSIIFYLDVSMPIPKKPFVNKGILELADFNEFDLCNCK